MKNFFHFIRGASHIFDFKQSTRSGHALKYDTTREGYSPSKIDREAIESDWVAIGNDYKKVFGEFDTQLIKNQ